MCDAGDYAVGAVWGQTKDKKHHGKKLSQDLNSIMPQLKKELLAKLLFTLIMLL
jgi:hypothetical protein